MVVRILTLILMTVTLDQQRWAVFIDGMLLGVLQCFGFIFERVFHRIYLLGMVPLIESMC